MDHPLAAPASDDLSALAWVHDELRRSLDAAHKSLRRYLKESEALGGSDVDSVDPSVLRSARSQIHQGVGALELVGLPEAALVLRASESLVQKFVAKPHKLTPLVVEQIEHASFAGAGGGSARVVSSSSICTGIARTPENARQSARQNVCQNVRRTPLRRRSGSTRRRARPVPGFRRRRRDACRAGPKRRT